MADDDYLWMSEWHEVEDTVRCDACRCFFVPEELLESDDGVRLCLDCINGGLQAEELSEPELLLLEDRRRG